MDLLLIISNVLLLFGIVTVVFLFYRNKNTTKRQLNTLHESMANLTRKNTSQTLCMSGLGKEIESLIVKMNNLECRLDGFENFDEKQLSYEQAAKLVGMGVDINELSVRCGLSRAEAELVCSMENSKQAL